MSSLWNNGLSLSIFGESHGPAIGVCMDNLPAGEEIDLEALQRFLARRSPGNKPGSTPRKESDEVQILSGFYQGRTTGTPLAMMIPNTNTRSGDYQNLVDHPRPGHADYTGNVRYRGYNDPRGGGHFSGRLTAPLVAAGGICAQILARRGITVGAHIASIGGVSDDLLDPVTVTAEQILSAAQKTFPVLNDEKGFAMQKQIEQARLDCDSIGGIIECVGIGLPAGIGSPMFDGLESVISALVFSIPAVKGVEFGAGFACAQMRGSSCNDAFCYASNGNVVTCTNRHGGILGGISSGMPLVIRAAIKPTPSIAQEQRTVCFSEHRNDTVAVRGRHDSCITVRAVPCVESAMLVALAGRMIAEGWLSE